MRSVQLCVWSVSVSLSLSSLSLAMASFFVCAVLLCVSVAGFSVPPRPHIISLFLDDHGFGDVGFNNKTVTETPHMDALAASGVIFRDMHSAASVCTPARAGLMTGRQPPRAGVHTNFDQESLYGLPVEEITIADVLRAANYSTQFLGKHHLGHHAKYSPTFRGFETWYGLPYSGDMGCIDDTPQSCKPGYSRTAGQPACPALCVADDAPTKTSVAIPLYDSTSANCSGHVSCNQDILTAPYNPMTLNAQYVQRAKSIIADHGKGGVLEGTPLFLHVAFAHTHTPLGYNPAFQNASSRPGWYRPFGDVLAEVDHAIGEIVGALEDGGMREETLIVLASDNGPADLTHVACEAKGFPGPYVGAWQKAASGGGGGATLKTTTWEGGHHVLGAASWPGVIKPGRQSNALASTLDYMPTFAALAGASLPTDRLFDGKDLTKVLTGEDPDGGHRTLFHMDNQGNLTAGRIVDPSKGSYTVYWRTAPAFPCRKPDGTHDPMGKAFEHNPPLVFDILNDPGESVPVPLPADLMTEIQAAHAALVASLTNTFHTVSNYTKGGTAAWPCGNVTSTPCRTHRELHN